MLRHFWFYKRQNACYTTSACANLKYIQFLGVRNRKKFDNHWPTTLFNMDNTRVSMFVAVMTERELSKLLQCNNIVQKSELNPSGTVTAKGLNYQ